MAAVERSPVVGQGKTGDIGLEIGQWIHEDGSEFILDRHRRADRRQGANKVDARTKHS